nr:MAG TPA: hypothetical protein [Caudoviricetes sp.]DAZ64572.1 MAG TPA: hypothetical protein [Caudoviricetes sp.]
MQYNFSVTPSLPPSNDFPLIFRRFSVTGGQEAVSSSLATRTKKTSKPLRFRGFFIFRLFWQILDYAQYFYPVTPAVTLA